MAAIVHHRRLVGSRPRVLSRESPRWPASAKPKSSHVRYRNALSTIIMLTMLDWLSFPLSFVCFARKAIALFRTIIDSTRAEMMDRCIYPQPRICYLPGNPYPFPRGSVCSPERAIFLRPRTFSGESGEAWGVVVSGHARGISVGSGAGIIAGRRYPEALRRKRRVVSRLV